MCPALWHYLVDTDPEKSWDIEAIPDSHEYKSLPSWVAAFDCYIVGCNHVPISSVFSVGLGEKRY